MICDDLTNEQRLALHNDLITAANCLWRAHEALRDHAVFAPEGSARQAWLRKVHRTAAELSTDVRSYAHVGDLKEVAMARYQARMRIGHARTYQLQAAYMELVRARDAATDAQFKCDVQKLLDALWTLTVDANMEKKGPTDDRE